MPRGDTILRANDELTIALEDAGKASPVRDLLLDGEGLDSTRRTDRVEIAIPPGVPEAGLLVRELSLGKGVLLVRVRRGGQMIIPHGDTVLFSGDLVEAMGQEGDLQALKAYLESLGT